MFGISAFAQSPFASLASTAFIASLSENLGLADASSTLGYHAWLPNTDHSAGFEYGRH